MSDKKVYEFSGSETDVQWDSRLCIHIAECGNAKGDLFQGGRDPWCLPDTSTRAEVREIVERCPSGALTFRDKDGSPELPAEENTLMVIYNGPLYAKGELDLEGVAEDMPGVRFRAALCRCGQSGNKPFCDNSHLQSGFEDYGSVGDKGPGASGSGGSLNIRALTDGPLLVKGDLTILAATGRVAWQGSETALCRCGASKNKPFCDGSHRSAGFKSD